jgi:hypothetical protein
MKKKLKQLGIRTTLLVLFCFSCSCTTDPNAGMVAARISGMPQYLSFQRNGSLESAALLPYKGQWWFYHPDTGSVPTMTPTSKEPPNYVALFLNGVETRPIWKDVKNEPADARLDMGCLPRALHSNRINGGVLIETRLHIENRY